MTSIGDADAEIRSLLARIAQLADTGDLDEYVTLFTDDAVWAMPDNPSLGMPASEKRGIAEIRTGAEERRAGGVQGPGTETRHVLTTTAVFVESDHRATARSYFMFYATTTTQPTLRNMGQYDDVLMRGNGGWQLAHRTITFG
jgi:3-phenylpropionate/cinnamic acid dioxygenase small subunit